MARLKDVPVVLRTVGFVPFLKRLWNEICDDHLFTFGAALAYAWLFAIFPFLIFLLNFVAVLPSENRQATMFGVQEFLRKALPDLAANAIWQNVHQQVSHIVDLNRPRGAVLSMSLLVALWAASGGITVTMAALDKCYEIDRARAYFKRRPMALGLTAMVSGLLFLVMLLLPAGAVFRDWVLEYRAAYVTRGAVIAFDVVRVILAIWAALLILAVLYHFGPCVKRRWHLLTPGSVFTFTVWIIVGLAFRYYVNHFGGSNYDRTYGTVVGGVAVLLLFFYLDAVVLLIGAEINSEIDYEILKVPRGSRNFRIAERVGEGRGTQTEVAADAQ